MANTKRWAVAAALAVAAAAVPFLASNALAALDDPSSGIPDSAMLQPEDLYGGEPAQGGPDQAVHPLPPRPCGDSQGPESLAALTIHATVRGHKMYEYVARYPSGVAAQVAEDLRAAAKQCPKGPGDVRHRIMATGLWGPHSALLTRDWDDTDGMDSYLVGVAGDYLLVVMGTGDGRLEMADLTLTSDVGSSAIRRAGGDPTPVRATPTPAGPAAADPTPTPATGEPEPSRPVAANQPTAAGQPTPRATMPADHCATDWFRATITEVPRVFSMVNRACDGDWAVVDVDLAAGACGPVDGGPRPGCTAQPHWRRFFLRFDNGWVILASTKDAGCAAVLATEPRFPTAFCEGLPAV